MFKASEMSFLNNSRRQAASVKVRARTGVAVRGLIAPNQRGASPSSTNISASREGTINVGFKEVVIAMMAPRVTKLAAPQGRYTEATSVIGAELAPSRAPGNTPK